MFTWTAQDWMRRSRKERRFIQMKRKPLRQTVTKKLTQLNTAAMRMRTPREQIVAVTMTSQPIAVIIMDRHGTIHNIIKLTNVAQLMILTGKIWPQNPRLLPISILPSRQFPSHYGIRPTDYPLNLFPLLQDDQVLRCRRDKTVRLIRLGFIPVQD